MAVMGTVVCVAVGDSELHIVDASDPSSPVGLGVYRTLGRITSVAASGNVVYIAEETQTGDKGEWGGGLDVLDVSDPSQPQELCFYPLAGWLVEVVLSGNLAYVLPHGGSLYALDVSNPAYPRALGAVCGVYDAYGLTLAGGLAYIANGSAGLEIVDLSDPTRPRYLGGYVTTDDARSVAVFGDTIYVAAEYEGLLILRCRNVEPDGEGCVVVVDNQNTIPTAWILSEDTTIEILHGQRVVRRIPLRPGWFTVTAPACDDVRLVSTNKERGAPPYLVQKERGIITMTIPSVPYDWFWPEQTPTPTP